MLRRCRLLLQKLYGYKTWCFRKLRVQLNNQRTTNHRRVWHERSKQRNELILPLAGVVAMKLATIALFSLLIVISLSIYVEAGTCTGAPNCQCLEVTPTSTPVQCETANDCSSVPHGTCEQVSCVNEICTKQNIPNCGGGSQGGGGGVGLCRPDPEYKDKTYQQLPLNAKHRTCTNSQACRTDENIEKFSKYKGITYDSTGAHQAGEDLICTPLTPDMDPPFKVGQCICGVEVPKGISAAPVQKPATGAAPKSVAVAPKATLPLKQIPERQDLKLPELPARPEIPAPATGAYQGKTNTSGALIGGVILVFVLFVALLILVYRPKPPKFNWHVIQEDIKKVEHAVEERLSRHKK